MPLPEEKHDDYTSAESAEKHHEEVDSDTGFDSLDLPEVPRVSVRATSDIPFAAETSFPSVKDSPADLVDTDSDLSKSNPSKKFEGEVGHPDTLTHARENKQFQFVPFVAAPPPRPLFMLPIERSDANPVSSPDLSPKFVAVPPPPPPFQLPSDQSESSPVLPRDPSTPFVSSPQSVSLPSKQSKPELFVSQDATPSAPHTKPEIDIDLQDVLSAAQAAAESADRAATAARAAASLAQVRIAELISKKNGSAEKNQSPVGSDLRNISEKPTFDQQNSFDNIFSSDDMHKMQDASPEAVAHAHQPQRSVSLEDDPYFSYPNLFSRQDSGLKPGAHSSDEHSR